MAPQLAAQPPRHNKEPTPEEPPSLGPPSGLSGIPTQFITEQHIRQVMKSIGCDEAREDTYRLKGVQLIDNVRESLQLPVKTFTTAAVYYHKFRIRFPSNEYSYEDVALTALFVACKVEDTIKKSRDILCASHNLKHPNDNKTPDDKAFDVPSRFTVGLERYILETIGFDFRVQYPQKLLIKMVRKIFPPEDSESERQRADFLRNAYDMSIDLYKTFAPMKQSTSTLAHAILELTAAIMDIDRQRVHDVMGSESHTSRGPVYETMLDLLDLYTQFLRMTKVGPRFDLQKMMDVKIEINKSMTEERLPRYSGLCDTCFQESTNVSPATPGSAASPATNSPFPGSSTSKKKGAAREETVRFVFDADEVRKEMELVAEYTNDEYEEYEVEVEEPIPEPESRPSHNSSRNSFAHRGGPSANDHGWGPYNRGRHAHPNDRMRGRRGGGYH